MFRYRPMASWGWVMRRESMILLHQWVTRRLTDQEKREIITKYPQALNRPQLGIDAQARLEHLAEVLCPS